MHIGNIYKFFLKLQGIRYGEGGTIVRNTYYCKKQKCQYPHWR